jgi:DNA-3-methyladenine glycosylase II
MLQKPMTKPTFEKALVILRQQDPKIDEILSQLGPPGWRKRRSGFPTLVRIILEQQVSLASGKAVFDRLQLAMPRFTPRNFLKISPENLRQIGFSRQKTRYCTELAEKIKEGDLRLGALEKMSEKGIREELIQVTGIGRWTIDIYLMEALKRPDIWPAGDLALAIAVQRLMGLKKRPTPEKLDRISKKWKPWRSVVARIFWHSYLNGTF